MNADNPYAPSPQPSGGLDTSARAAAERALAAVPPAPRTPTPRAQMILSRLGVQRGAFIGAGVFFLMGSLFSYIFAAALPGDFALALFAKNTTGTVVSREVQSNVKINGVHPTIITFRYEIGGASHESQSAVLNVEPQWRKKDAPVDVEYLASMPDVARIAGTTKCAGGYAMVFLYMFPIGAVLIVVLNIVGARTRRRVFVHGTPLLGKITTVTMPVRSGNRFRPGRVVWSYTDPRGVLRSGSLGSDDTVVLADYSEGQDVIVLYLPQRPSKSVLFMA